MLGNKLFFKFDVGDLSLWEVERIQDKTKIENFYSFLLVFYMLLGCFTVDFGALSREQPH